MDLLRKDDAAISWLTSSEEQALYTSEVNVFELYTGLYRISKNTSKSKMKKRAEELEQVLTRMEVLPFEREASIESARLLADMMNKGKPVGARDVMIAGTTLANGIHRLLTRNTKHFQRISGLIIESY